MGNISVIDYARIRLYLEPFKSYKALKVSKRHKIVYSNPVFDPPFCSTKRGEDMSGTEL